MFQVETDAGLKKNLAKKVRNEHCSLFSHHKLANFCLNLGSESEGRGLFERKLTLWVATPCSPAPPEEYSYGYSHAYAANPTNIE